MSEATVCAVCGKPIEPSASRYVDVDPATKVKQHVHTECKQPH
jgi:uncharacterized protein with PIN domain